VKEILLLPLLLQQR